MRSIRGAFVFSAINKVTSIMHVKFCAALSPFISMS